MDLNFAHQKTKLLRSLLKHNITYEIRMLTISSVTRHIRPAKTTKCPMGYTTPYIALKLYVSVFFKLIYAFVK